LKAKKRSHIRERFFMLKFFRLVTIFPPRISRRCSTKTARDDIPTILTSALGARPARKKEKNVKKFLPQRKIKMNYDEDFDFPVDPPPEKYSRRVRVRFIFAAFICSVTVVILIFLFSPFFYVESVIINGNMRVSEEEIKNFLEINEKSHLLLYNTRAAKKRILQNVYIGNVEFERVLPGRLYVNLQERRLTAFFEHSFGSFLYLDDYGRVLEVKTFFTEPLPILVGLQFTRFQLGEILEVPDSAAFNVVVQYAQLLNQYALIEKVTHINVNDSANIRIIVRNKEFNVGGVANADEKIRTIAAVLEEMPNADLIPGFMDLREVRKEYFFEIAP